METKGKPTGFIAVCRCGSVIGAVDAVRSNRLNASGMVYDWLLHGYTVEAQFGASWTAALTSCQCKETP